MAIKMKIADKPMLMRNNAAKTPSRFIGLNVALGVKPRREAKPKIMAACSSERITADNTLDIIIEHLATGVLKTLFKKPKRRSQTIDMPLNIVVNSTTNV